jgi:hypothetical protein
MEFLQNIIIIRTLFQNVKYSKVITRFSTSGFFFIKQLSQGTWYTDKNLYEYGFEFAKKIEIAVTKNDP